MKRIILSALTVTVAAALSTGLPAQTPATRTDSIATALRINSLNLQKEGLEKEIKVQDAKRDSRITGVSPETLEMMNNRQDSICLDLRSRLTDVILQIKEITPETITPEILRQYQNLINQQAN